MVAYNEHYGSLYNSTLTAPYSAFEYMMGIPSATTIMMGIDINTNNIDEEVGVGIIEYARNTQGFIGPNSTFLDLQYSFGHPSLDDNFVSLVTTHHTNPVNLVTGYERRVNGSIFCMSTESVSVSCPEGLVSFPCNGTGILTYQCGTRSRRPQCNLLVPHTASCTMVAYSTTNTTCRCIITAESRRRLALSSGSSRLSLSLYTYVANVDTIATASFISTTLSLPPSKQPKTASDNTMTIAISTTVGALALLVIFFISLKRLKDSKEKLKVRDFAQSAEGNENQLKMALDILKPEHSMSGDLLQPESLIKTRFFGIQSPTVSSIKITPVNVNVVDIEAGMTAFSLEKEAEVQIRLPSLTSTKITPLNLKDVYESIDNVNANMRFMLSDISDDDSDTGSEQPQLLKQEDPSTNVTHVDNFITNMRNMFDDSSDDDASSGLHMSTGLTKPSQPVQESNHASQSIDLFHNLSWDNLSDSSYSSDSVNLKTADVPSSKSPTAMSKQKVIPVGKSKTLSLVKKSVTPLQKSAKKNISEKARSLFPLLSENGTKTKNRGVSTFQKSDMLKEQIDSRVASKPDQKKGSEMALPGTKNISITDAMELSLSDSDSSLG